MLLNQLTKGNANIQKIVAFENAFERILDIIVEEGSSDGGQELQKKTVFLFRVFPLLLLCPCLLSSASDIFASQLLSVP